MLPLEYITAGDLLRRTSLAHGDRPAIWYRGKYITYTELEDASRRYAAVFASHDICNGSHVALWTEPEPEALFAYYALERIGAVTLLINTNLVDEELIAMLSQSDAEYLVAGKSLRTGRSLAEGHAALFKNTDIREFFSVGETTFEDFIPMQTAASDPSEEAFKKAEALEASVTPDDTATIIFTSGSTSAPKGVMSSHFSRVNGGIQQASDLLCTKEDKFCVTMPMFHCFCISVNIMAALAVGGCVCIPEDRHINSILDAVENCGCTVLNSVPSMFHSMLSRNKNEGRDLSSLRIGFIGGSSYPPEAFIRIEKALGPQFTLMSSLGQTECTAGLTTCFPDDTLDVRAHTIGHFMSHVEGRIADPHTGETLPLDTTGEICVRGYLNMQGYYKRPDLTAQAIDQDGWVHTGDLGKLDADGNITFEGRIKELIIRGGENISPVEIEAVLADMPGIESCKITGVPDIHYGEVVCACIIPEDGAAFTREEVRDFLSPHLAAYKLPEYVCLFDEFPATATGKIKPSLIRQKAMEKLGLQ